MAKVNAFIQEGIDVNTKVHGCTPLHCAARHGHKEVAELLIAKGADVNAGPWTALHTAVNKGRRDIAELPIQKGAEVNAKDDWGRNPLWYAEKKGHTEIAELLRKHGAKE